MQPYVFRSCFTYLTLPGQSFASPVRHNTYPTIVPDWSTMLRVGVRLYPMRDWKSASHFRLYGCRTGYKIFQQLMLTPKTLRGSGGFCGTEDKLTKTCISCMNLNLEYVLVVLGV